MAAQVEALFTLQRVCSQARPRVASLAARISDLTMLSYVVFSQVLPSFDGCPVQIRPPLHLDQQLCGCRQPPVLLGVRDSAWFLASD